MNITTKVSKPRAQLLLHIVAAIIVAGSLFFAGVWKHGGAKDVDTRYFYAAAKCWAAGRSPYEATTYDAAFTSIFRSHPVALFVAYPPTLIPLVLPMALFSWPVAAALFSWMNFAAAMALYWACYKLVGEVAGAPLGLEYWFWVVLASTIGGIGGTIFTGQSSLLITSACALALLGCRLGRMWLTVAGLVAATAKPHLSGPLLLFILLFEPRQRRAIAVAAGIAALFVAYAAAVDSSLVHSYVQSIHTYNTLAANDPAKMVGLVALLLRLGVPLATAQWVGVVGLLLVLLLAGWLLIYTGRPLTSLPVAVMLLTFSIGLARGIQGYDVSCYALGIALMATLDFRYRCALLVPVVLVWRPALLQKAGLVISQNQILSYAWIGLLIGTVILAASDVQACWTKRSSALVAEASSI